MAIAATAAVAFCTSRAHAALIEFDINAISVRAVDSGNQPALMTNANFAGSLALSKNAGSFMNGVLYNSVSLTPPTVTLVNITGSFKVDNGFSDGGSVSLTFQNADSSTNVYTFNIPVDAVRSSSDIAVNQQVGGTTRYTAGWTSNTNVFSIPEVAGQTFPNPLGWVFLIHDFIPSQTAGAGLGLDNLVNMEIAVDVPQNVPEPASLLLMGAGIPALLMRRWSRK